MELCPSPFISLVKNECSYVVALKRLRQEDPKFEFSVGYIIRSYLRKSKESRKSFWPALL